MFDATIRSMISSPPDEAPALGAPGRDWLSYGTLRALSERAASALRDAGIGATDRVAIVLPNGPEMAAAFVTLAQAATTAPIRCCIPESSPLCPCWSSPSAWGRRHSDPEKGS